MSTRQSKATTTDFGYEQVSPQEKTRRVRGVFDSVANKYDVMNDLMSLGVHRLWKHFAMARTGLKPGQTALDLAGGTGDLARVMAQQVGLNGRVVLADINDQMLAEGRRRLVNAGIISNLEYAQVNAETLPFEAATFHCITIAFGLRNVSNKERALTSMYRALKPGGRLLVLEFSHPTWPGLQPIYDMYSFKLLPLMGRLVANDEDSYRYLAESIRMHPDQSTLKTMMQTAGFEDCRYHNLSGGIVALHVGYKY